MLKKLGFSFILLTLVSLAACDLNGSKDGLDSGLTVRNVIWDNACSGKATIKGRVELNNLDCGSKYSIFAVKQTKIGIFDSLSRRLIETRFEVVNEATDRKKILEQDAPSNFSATLEAGYYLIYAYPTACSAQTNRHWTLGDTLRVCGGEVKDFGTVKF
jgi:hypothetical protein